MVDVVWVLVGVGSRRALFGVCGAKKLSRVRFFDIVVVWVAIERPNAQRQLDNLIEVDTNVIERAKNA